MPLPTAYEVALLRIAQAALANTVRHADAATAEITLSYLSGRIALDIVDDGTGFDLDRLPVADPEKGGFGLGAMRGRTQALGGTFILESTPAHGTALAARLPLPEANP
ncbi:sensor histidine kinase [Amycolatopsis sp. cmx-11-51]|uniref:sensor histidine kinase n=1 Tax=unclassified Amycolatopsis TaxID=2618356 RepID=UPI0039E65531